MRRGGRKPELPSVKEARGTFQPSRDGGRVEIIAPDQPPQQPDWLTAEGEQVWLDDIGRVLKAGIVKEVDSTAFGNYCNLQGAITKAWTAGEVPPAAYLAEARRLAEQFGVLGDKSRLLVIKPGGTDNPFKRNGPRK